MVARNAGAGMLLCGLMAGPGMVLGQGVSIPSDKYASVSGFVGYDDLDDYSATTWTPAGGTISGIAAFDEKSGYRAEFDPELSCEEDGRIFGTVAGTLINVSSGESFPYDPTPIEGIGRFREDSRVRFDEVGNVFSDTYRWSSKAGLKSIRIPESSISQRLSARLNSSGRFMDGFLYPTSKNENREDWTASVRFSLRNGDFAFRGLGEFDLMVDNDALGFGGFGITKNAFNPTNDAYTQFEGDAYYTSPFGTRNGGDTLLRIKPYNVMYFDRPGYVGVIHRNEDAVAAHGAHFYRDQASLISDYEADGMVELGSLPRITNRTLFATPQASQRLTLTYPKEFLESPPF